MSKLSMTILASILLSAVACTSTPQVADESLRTPATKMEDTDTDSESDRLHHQKVLNRIDRIGSKRSF